MTVEYNHDKIEKKWSTKWVESGVFTAIDFSPKPKKFILAEFPYPSGAALHAGHMMRYTVPDVYSRYLRMNGFNVMFPMGWDAFGLPAENYAVKTGIHPSITTQNAIKTMKESLIRMGYGIDWSREINTTDPSYYKWTQWLFLKFWENGLAEIKEMPVWWCEKLKTVLADEEVLTDHQGNKISERGEHPVEKRLLKQWVLKIPEYAEKLLEGLNTVDFPDSIKSAQTNWIGKSVGAEVLFKLDKSNENIEVFTTRIDTIYGATFLVISPEHPLVSKITTEDQKDVVLKYVNQAKLKSDLERTETIKEKTGVFSGSYAINPFSEEKIPVWIGDFVVMSYGTGAIMAVPAHDERDFEFAQKYDLPIKYVIKSDPAKYLVIEKSFEPEKIKELSNFGSVSVESEDPIWGKFYRVNVPLAKEPSFIDFVQNNILETSPDGGGWYADSMGTTHTVIYRGVHFTLTQDIYLTEAKTYGLSVGIPEDQVQFTLKPNTEKGTLINSEEYSGLSSVEAAEKLLGVGAEKGFAMPKTNYKMREWLFSRQRYWGEPIPLVHIEPKEETVLLLHGWGNNGNSGFFPNLKANLVSKGYKVESIELPNTQNPKIEDWVSAVESVINDKDLSTVTLIGHSSGGFLTLKLAERYKFKSIVLVSPVTPTKSFSETRISLTEQWLNGDILANYYNFHDCDFNFDQIKSNVKDITFYFGDKDKYSDEVAINFYKYNFKDSAKINVLAGYGHMGNSEMKAKSMPVIENIFPALNIEPICSTSDKQDFNKELPLVLPEVPDYTPSSDATSPLAKNTNWINTKTKDGRPAKREANTMPNWAGSCWYYLRYTDPTNNDFFADPEKLKYWLPVDRYFGGMEHTTMHLLYSRFWHKFFYDLGIVPTQEPYAWRLNGGLLLGPDGKKMSKSIGNVIDPMTVVENYGADALRLYIAFLGPYEDTYPWNENGIRACWRLVKNVYELQNKVSESYKDDVNIERAFHKMVKNITNMAANLKMNTCVSEFMIFANTTKNSEKISLTLYKEFIKIFSPFAPFVSEELWQSVNNFNEWKKENSVHLQDWPKYDEKLTIENTIKIPVQINGKVKFDIEINTTDSEDTVKNKALSSDKGVSYFKDLKINKVVYVPKRVLNIVTLLD